MIVGKDFVIINMPKTGSIFRRWVTMQYNYRSLCPAWCEGMKMVSDFLHSSIAVGSQSKERHRKKLSCSYYIRMGIYKILIYVNHYPTPLARATHHLSAKKAHKLGLIGKEILSVLRNPYSQIASRYQQAMRNSMRERVGDFEAYIRHFTCDKAFCLIRNRQAIKLDYPLGILSYHFIRMHFKDPAKIFAMSADEFDAYCISDDYKKDMYPIKFFRLETMNQDLCEYLKSKPYLDSQIIDEIFNEAKPKNVSKKREDVVWDKETKAYFEKTEKFYIRMVKELAPLPEDDF